jgi:hypothetical protein
MNSGSATNWVRAAIAFSSIATGWIFYILVRATDPTRLLDQSLVKSISYVGILPDVFQSAPTFFHALSVAFLLSLVTVRRSTFWMMWIGSTFGYEILQFFAPAIGTFDLVDLLSIALVMPVCLTLSQRLTASMETKTQQALALGFAAISSLASSGPGYDPSTTHIPICMSAEEFRSAFLIDVPQPIKTAGKIHLKGNLLLVSEPFEGIHVFDNTDPAKPVAVAFIRIPGNTDLATKDNLLYVDSAVDLLTIKFQGNNAALVSRLENVFTPRTPADFSTDNVYVPQNKMKECEESGGVVVGFRTNKDGDVFEKKIEENKK